MRGLPHLGEGGLGRGFVVGEEGSEGVVDCEEKAPFGDVCKRAA